MEARGQLSFREVRSYTRNLKRTVVIVRDPPALFKSQLASLSFCFYFFKTTDVFFLDGDLLVVGEVVSSRRHCESLRGMRGP